VQAKQFPSPVTAQEADCCGGQGGKCPGSPSVYQTDNVWIALNFNIPDPHMYRPIYTSTGTAGTSTFTATVNGDLDCDGIHATFRRMGSINGSSGDVQAAAAAYTDKEIE
jgi:hypothetical protein